VAALRWFVDYRLTGTGVTPDFSAETLESRFPPEIETACFRVTQEALTNVLTHAQASRVSVELRQTGESLKLTIRDDGRDSICRPFGRQPSRGPSGASGMQERIRAAGTVPHRDVSRDGLPDRDRLWGEGGAGMDQRGEDRGPMKPFRVLLADDHALFRAGLKALLTGFPM
jgi:signal transduction histidine kinase